MSTKKVVTVFLTGSLFGMFVGVIVVLGVIVSLRPSLLGSSEDRLMASLKDAPEFERFYQIITTGPGFRVDAVQGIHNHVVALNSVHWNESKDTLCIVYSQRVPLDPRLSWDLERNDVQARMFGKARLLNSANEEIAPVNGSSLAFETDVVDSASFILCYDGVPGTEDAFRFVVDDPDKDEKYAEFTISIPTG